MGRDGFEHLLMLQCAPTFAGMKAASLVCFRRCDFDDLDGMVASCQRLFTPAGIVTLKLYEDSCRTMLYFYRSALLKRVLKRPGAVDLLRGEGYPTLGGIDSLLRHLMRRLSEHGDFPHEIGLFLGYPPPDVKCFIENHGHGAKCTGVWKVYQNVAAAKVIFSRYRHCTEEGCIMLREAGSMAALAGSLGKRRVCIDM